MDERTKLVARLAAAMLFMGKNEPWKRVLIRAQDVLVEVVERAVAILDIVEEEKGRTPVEVVEAMEKRLEEELSEEGLCITRWTQDVVKGAFKHKILALEEKK